VIDILVHLDAAPRAEEVARVAGRLAEGLGGRLNGFFNHVESFGPAVVARRASARYLDAARQAEILFRSVSEHGAWTVPASGEEGQMVSSSVFCSRFADLVVMGQWHEQAHVPEDLVEKVVMGAGRPVLVVPYAGHFPSIGQRVAVAWNGSREAARAIHDALPLLHKATAVTLVSITDNERPRAKPGPRLDMASHLAAKGIAVDQDRMGPSEIGAMDQLLSHVCDLGADLLVMGAHGHLGPLARLRHSGTRHILRHLTVPVLMSH
jgi:nucleotide-binding universal stress UspA family protein